MSTKQHLIEQECMDKLGWDISQVAQASDKEMIIALQNFKKPKPINTNNITPPVEKPFEFSESIISHEKQDIGRHHIQLLKQQIDKKLKFIHSNDGSDDDIALFRTSIEKDKTVLGTITQSIQQDIMLKEELIRKKRSTKELLESFRVDGTLNNDDEQHILLIQGQLHTIQSELDECRNLL